MFSPARNVLLGLVVTFILAATVVARVLLCPRCGHEIDPTQTICPHCQNALTPAPDAVTPTPDAKPVAAGSVVMRSVVEGELASARAALEGDRPALAWLKARNLAGLLALSPDAAQLGPARSEVERGALAAMRKRDRVCPVCKGEGTKTLLFVNVQGEPSRQKAPGQACPACQGTGHWLARPTEDQRAGAFAQAQRDFLQGMRDAGWKASGPAWLPPDIAPLTARQIAAVRRAVAGPCESCRGLGLLGCEECRGAGRLPCSNDECVGGRVVCPDCKGTRRRQAEEDERTLTRRCTTCRQTGVADCPTCKGQGFLSCDACETRGEVRCERCDGRGERALCTGCAGEGVRACKRCKGSGTYRDAECPQCHGEGVELCSACQGEGHARR